MNKLLASIILNRYAQDMGNYFDYIQGNEDDTLDYIMDTLHTLSPIQKIKFITHTLFAR